MDKLTDVMRAGLEYYADPAVLAAPTTGTVCALIRRGLLTAGTTHEITNAGWAALNTPHAPNPPKRVYTVIGLWIDGEPLVVGVMEGKWSCVDSDMSSGGFERWATSVRATSADDAEAKAYAKMAD